MIAPTSLSIDDGQRPPLAGNPHGSSSAHAVLFLSTAPALARLAALPSVQNNPRFFRLGALQAEVHRCRHVEGEGGPDDGALCDVPGQWEPGRTPITPQLQRALSERGIP
jgi:hypothetical protein